MNKNIIFIGIFLFFSLNFISSFNFNENKNNQLFNFPSDKILGSDINNNLNWINTSSGNSSNLSNYVPYTGATSNLDLGNNNLNIGDGYYYQYGNVNAFRLSKGSEMDFTNILIGKNAGNSTSKRQTAIGYYAGNVNIGDSQTAIGYFAGISNIGLNQISIGENSGSSNTGDSQTAIGYYAGVSNTGDSQTAIGTYAGSSNTGLWQTVIGDFAGSSNTKNYQTAIGTYAGSSNTGDSQTAIGTLAGEYNSGNNTISIGYEAGSLNVGNKIIGMGYYSNYNNSGNNVVAMGYEAGKDNTASNQFIVKQSNINSIPLIQGNFSSGYIGIGTTTPQNTLNVIGEGNFTGNLYVNNNFSVGTSNLFVNANTGYIGIGTTTPSYKLEVQGEGLSNEISSEAGFNIKYVSPPPNSGLTGVAQAGTGLEIGTYQYSIYYYTATGHTSGARTTTSITTTAGNQQILVTIPVSGDHRVKGRKLFRSVVGGYYGKTSLVATISNDVDTTYVDSLPDASLGTLSDNYNVGDTTSNYITAGDKQILIANGLNTALGLLALSGNTGSNNVGIGASAGKNSGSSKLDVFVGKSAGYSVEGSGYIAIGPSAGFRARGGGSVFVGQEAGYKTQGANSIMIGKYAGFPGIISGIGNMGIGFYSMYMQSAGVNFTGAYNLFLGYNSGRWSNGQVMSVSNSIGIGKDVYTTKSNQVILGNTAVTETLLRGNVGIGTTNPTYLLDVNGTINSANKITASESTGTTNGGFSFTQDGAQDTGMFSPSDGIVSLYSNGVNGLTMINGGNIGIGLTNPINKLEVNGSLRLSGTGNNLYLGGTSKEGSIQNADSIVGLNDLKLYANSSETSPDLYISNSGNVGIGISNPNSTLQIANNINSGIGNLEKAQLIISDRTDQLKRVLIGYDNSTDNGFINSGISGVSWGNLIFQGGGGKVGIGAISPTYQFQLSTDSAAKPSTNTWTVASDRRIKKNINYLNNYSSNLEWIKNFPDAITYNYNNLLYPNLQNITNYGFIAQDVKAYSPNMTTTKITKLTNGTSINLISVNTNELNVRMLPAMKELIKENELLKLELCQRDNSYSWC